MIFWQRKRMLQSQARRRVLGGEQAEAGQGGEAEGEVAEPLAEA